MALYVAEHTHAGENCPARQPQMAQGLLQIVNPANARKAGITIHADAVADGKHQLYLIVEAPSEADVRAYFSPFAQFGTFSVSAASHCEKVVERQHC